MDNILKFGVRSVKIARSAWRAERMQALVAGAERSREHPRAQRMFVRPTLDAALVMLVDDAGLTLRSIADWMGVSDWAASKMRQAATLLYSTDVPTGPDLIHLLAR